MANENNKYKQAEINEFGDIVCPNCFINIITPGGHYIKQGNYHCSCGIIFEVGKEVIKDVERIKTGTDTAGKD
ncbi:hypothetical protein LCGC14_2657710 [marine sediment metagenome]|uniref:Uncharacterized protein n=1 Tax=marine sediment metagenome TaxID=412755 RepID=A0A0F9AF84_9ZZZZ